MKNIPIYLYFIVLSFCFSCSETTLKEEIYPENILTETCFSTVPSAAFADVYESRIQTKTGITDVVKRVKYIVYDEAGNNVQEKELTKEEIRDGFRVDLPAGEYRICVLGEGGTVNYEPTGYPPTEIKVAPSLGGIWVAANQPARVPVYHDYFFASREFSAGSPGIKPILLRRVTGLLQVEIQLKDPDITLNMITIGFPANRMYNNFHTDGRYSCSGQSVENALPYAIYHTLNFNMETGYYEGVYFPTLTGNADCTFVVSYIQGGKIHSRNICLSGLPVKANQRTRLPLVIM